MRFSFHTLKAATATIVSLWMAVLACFIACTMPVFAESGSLPVHVAKQSESARMMDMENCPHHSGGDSPAKPSDPAKPGDPAKHSDDKPIPADRMSCCPLEVTVAPKAKTESLSIAATADFLLPSDGNLMWVRFNHSVEPVPAIRNSGRDTLLKTHLLRI
jgi:hypothetical protein